MLDRLDSLVFVGNIGSHSRELMAGQLLLRAQGSDLAGDLSEPAARGVARAAADNANGCHHYTNRGDRSERPHRSVCFPARRIRQVKYVVGAFCRRHGNGHEVFQVLPGRQIRIEQQRKGRPRFMLVGWQEFGLELNTLSLTARALYESGIITRTLQHDLRKSIRRGSDEVVRLRTDMHLTPIQSTGGPTRNTADLAPLPIPPVNKGP